MIYFVVFIISIFSTKLAQINLKNKFFFILFSSIAVLLPSALAALRDVGVGTDTDVYSEKVFLAIRNHHYSLSDFISTALNPREGELGAGLNIEIGYLLLNYIVSLFFDDLAWLHFFINFIVVLFFYLSAYDNRRIAPMWLVMTLFFFLFYNISLNIMRQSIAVAMSLYAFKYIENEKWFRSAIWALLIFFMHSSGLFFIVLLIVRWGSYLPNKGLVLIMQIAFATIISLFFLAFGSVLSVLAGISDSFARYSEAYGNEQTQNTDKVQIALYLCMLLIMIFSRRGARGRQIQDVNFYIYNKTLGIIFSLVSTISVTVSRSAMYLNVFDCIFIPRLLRQLSFRNKPLSDILIFTLVIGVIIYWYINIIVLNLNETYPYKSKLLDSIF